VHQSKAQVSISIDLIKLIFIMENPAIILWIPIILLSVASIIKMLNKGGPNGKSWIRIEKVEENE